MHWRHKLWPEDCFSLVQIDFSEQENVANIKVSLKDIPETVVEITEEAWKKYYFNAIKEKFSF